jgi:EpsI family protein
LGNRIRIKLGVLVGLFLITCVFIYSRKEIPHQNKLPLKAYFQSIGNYKAIRHIELVNDHITMLKLDDYVYTDYEGPDGKVNLYIGYYYTANKAYAAHSPLTCYPSQGWEITRKPTTHTLEIGPHTIHYEEIITSLGEERELVIYWYQSYLQTNTQIYQNKIDMGFNNLINKTEQHAFVRVSIPLQHLPKKNKKRGAENFIHQFYPQFIDFIIGSTV